MSVHYINDYSIHYVEIHSLYRLFRYETSMLSCIRQYHTPTPTGIPLISNYAYDMVHPSISSNALGSFLWKTSPPSLQLSYIAIPGLCIATLYQHYDSFLTSAVQGGYVIVLR